MTTSKNYADLFCDELVKQGYTHCFYLAGGNIMHLLNSVSSRFVCIPVVHEVTAGIAAEYFNEANLESERRAFVLVTAGPGLTNLITAVAGAYLESRELLIVGGQVKSSDLKSPELRQNGIQEIDGVTLLQSITIDCVRVDKPYELENLLSRVTPGNAIRKGPVFVEFCLDIQAYAGEIFPEIESKQTDSAPKIDESSKILERLSEYSRPVLLVGGGVTRKFASLNQKRIESLPFPVMTTWNAADRMDSSAKNYMGRPNTWGQRYSNIVIQQADLIFAVGTRLGLQQTGFNWQEFAPVADVVHVDLDKTELSRSNLQTKYKVQQNADDFLETLLCSFESLNMDEYGSWLLFSQNVKNACPLSERVNDGFSGFWNPYDFLIELSRHIKSGDAVIPSSSGASETVTMQSLMQPAGCHVITNKALASMGYGLAGAIGAAFKTGKRVIHIEGDGGFAQNLQDLGTVSKNSLPIKTFIFSNKGYASIRTTQKSYFDGRYIGCDEDTGLGIPNWKKLFDAYDISLTHIDPNKEFSKEVCDQLNDDRPRAFLVEIHPEQTYFPKITSRVLADGTMSSNPIHLMTPELPTAVAQEVFKFLTI
jgi:acetolactate synthase-1/2/3 large subunit